MAVFNVKNILACSFPFFLHLYKKKTQHYFRRSCFEFSVSSQTTLSPKYVISNNLHGILWKWFQLVSVSRFCLQFLFPMQNFRRVERWWGDKIEGGMHCFFAGCFCWGTKLVLKVILPSPSQSFLSWVILESNCNRYLIFKDKIIIWAWMEFTRPFLLFLLKKQYGKWKGILLLCTVYLITSRK